MQGEKSVFQIKTATMLIISIGRRRRVTSRGQPVHNQEYDNNSSNNIANLSIMWFIHHDGHSIDS